MTHTSVPPPTFPRSAKFPSPDRKLCTPFANHGALAISYHGDSDVISEGESYRVVLDPPDDASGKPDPDPAKRSSRRSKGFLLLLIGAGAATATTWHKRSDFESPDHPCPGPSKEGGREGGIPT